MTEATAKRGGRALCAAGLAAGACFALALLGFGAALEGYAHAAWPVALLGAAGVPRATAFNLLGFVLPGLLAALVMVGRRGRLGADAGLAARLGWTLALLAALAFALQGLFPLDASAPDAGSGRLHGVAWGVWGIAFAAGGALLAADALVLRRPGDAIAHLAAAMLVFVLAWLVAGAIPAALAQRAAFITWFTWVAWAGCGLRTRRLR